jgi:hypothetical protein
LAAAHHPSFYAAGKYGRPAIKGTARIVNGLATCPVEQYFQALLIHLNNAGMTEVQDCRGGRKTLMTFYNDVMLST